tara:strand:+ start:517 stop:2022 length:1506 start_codon:yes stop_codon:yes gene_type:complete
MPAPQMIETPAMRRSAMLAKLLEEQRQPVEIKGGYGELAARLLGQGITQFSANRAEKAAKEERAARTAGEADAFGLTLANVLRDSGGAPPVPAMPAAAPPPVLPPISNTQQPVEAMTAPAAPVVGSAMPPAAPAGMPAPMPPMADVPPMPQAVAPAALPQMAPQAAPQAPAQIAPQSAANPLGITPGEMARIQEGVDAFRRTGDPAIGAWVRGEIDLVRQRMSAPAAERQEFQSINGVPGVVDPITRRWTPLEGGVPQAAMNTNQVVGAGNVFGLPEGSGVSLNPFGVPSVVGRPPEGFTRGVGGGLAPESGGSQDLNAPTRRFTELTNLRKEIDPIIDSATLLQRNIQALRAGSRAQNGAGDIAMINGLQKLIDEGVVREGDVALQLQAQGINGGIAGLQGYLTSSGRFSPQIRAQLLATGEDIYQNMNAVYRDRVLSYEPLVTDSFGPEAFNSVLPSRTRQAFGWGGDEAPAPRQQRRSTAPNRPSQPASGNNDPLGLR